LHAVLAVFVIGLQANLALDMEEGSSGVVSTPVAAMKTYFGSTDFMNNYKEEPTNKQLFDLFVLNELIDQKDVVGVCLISMANNAKQ
jgi:uncharacterized RDD family membrane protein YckC